MWSKFKAFWANLPLQAKLVAIAGFVAVVVAKYRDVLMNLILTSANRLMKKTEDKDAELAKQENQAKSEANKLVEEANKLPEGKPTVTEDWYKK